jgi:hypothetical protein
MEDKIKMLKNISPLIIYADLEYDEEEDMFYCRLGFRYISETNKNQRNGWEGFESDSFETIIAKVTKFISAEQNGFTIVMTDNPYKK